MSGPTGVAEEPASDQHMRERASDATIRLRLPCSRPAFALDAPTLPFAERQARHQLESDTSTADERMKDGPSQSTSVEVGLEARESANEGLAS